jgi:hypothetical protein
MTVFLGSRDPPIDHSSRDTICQLTNNQGKGKVQQTAGGVSRSSLLHASFLCCRCVDIRLKESSRDCWFSYDSLMSRVSYHQSYQDRINKDLPAVQQTYLYYYIFYYYHFSIIISSLLLFMSHIS